MTYSQEQPNSLQLMEKFNKALEDIDKLNVDCRELQKKMDTKLAIINTIGAYTASLENAILNDNNEETFSRIIFGHNKSALVGGNYDSYGEVLHAKYIQYPTNVFNILTAMGPIFKDNVEVKIYASDDGSLDWEEPDDAYQYKYCNILKHESDKSKEDVFETYSTNLITMSITATSEKILGGMRFDTLEICPYLPGSFDIQCIRLYDVDQYYTGDMTLPRAVFYGSGDNNPEEILMKKVGNTRYQLNNSYELYRIEIDFILNYDENGGFPFGLRHLYFYDTAADTASDYVVVEVTTPGYIETIGETVRLFTVDGLKEEISSTEYGIEYFMYYNNGVLDQQIETNTIIARNIKTFFAKIPLTVPVMGIEFPEIILR